MVPVCACRVPREPIRSGPHFRGRPAGQARADEPVIDGRLRPPFPRAICGLVVTDAHEAIFRAQRVQPRVVLVATSGFACIEGVRGLCLQVASNRDLVAVLVGLVNCVLYLRPDGFQYGRLPCIRIAASRGDVCVDDDQFRAVCAYAHPRSLQPSRHEYLDARQLHRRGVPPHQDACECVVLGCGRRGYAPPREFPACERLSDARAESFRIPYWKVCFLEEDDVVVGGKGVHRPPEPGVSLPGQCGCVLAVRRRRHSADAGHRRGRFSESHDDPPVVERDHVGVGAAPLPSSLGFRERRLGLGVADCEALALRGALHVCDRILPPLPGDCVGSLCHRHERFLALGRVLRALPLSCLPRRPPKVGLRNRHRRHVLPAVCSPCGRVLSAVVVSPPQ